MVNELQIPPKQIQEQIPTNNNRSGPAVNTEKGGVICINLNKLQQSLQNEEQ